MKGKLKKRIGLSDFSNQNIYIPNIFSPDMKTLFIPSKKKFSISASQISRLSKSLPNKIAIVYSIQFKELAEKIKSELPNTITLFQQVLGCSKPKISKETEAILLIGEGKFHALGLSIETQKPVFIASTGSIHRKPSLGGGVPVEGLKISNNKTPEIFIFSGEKLDKVSEKEIKRYQQRKKAAYMQFLHADKVGILVSTKPGQNRLERAEKLKKKLEKQNKEVHIFISNNINPQEFENFPDIQSWINTACPRMDMADERNRIVNLGDVE